LLSRQALLSLSISMQSISSSALCFVLWRASVNNQAKMLPLSLVGASFFLSLAALHEDNSLAVHISKHELVDEFNWLLMLVMGRRLPSRRLQMALYEFMLLVLK
jgi:hypothetical protein